jgi:microcystin-dependent protein
MTQAADLGAIANVPGASFRTRVNAGFQAVTSWHYGPSAPDPTYPLMLWGDQSTGKVWLRDPANAAWAEVGLLGPPFTWTAVAAAAGGGASTGDVKATFRAAAEDGWVLMDDGSIGAAGSGATSRANADCEDLFALLWSNVANAWAPLQDATGAAVGRGASAAADWAAKRRLLLPKMLGRAIACAGWGADLSDRALGERTGAESHILTTDEMPSHTHGASTNSTGSHSHTLMPTGSEGYSSGYAGGRSYGGSASTGSAGSHSHTVTVGATGGGQPHSLMQPTAFLNFQIRL